jgi:peptide deformylase
MLVKIKRPKDIRCRFQTPNGDVLTKQFTGMTARIFQHEMDLINGVIFYNRANRYHKEQALKKWNRGERYEMKVNVK